MITKFSTLNKSLAKGWGKKFFFQNFRISMMDSSSDEDFLPDPERDRGGFDLPFERKTKPPDKKRKLDEAGSS